MLSPITRRVSFAYVRHAGRGIDHVEGGGRRRPITETPGADRVGSKQPKHISVSIDVYGPAVMARASR